MKFEFKKVLCAITAGAALVASSGVSAATELVLPNEVAVSHWKTGYMNEFAEEVKKRTNGEILTKVFPAGQLYNDQDAMAALGTGAVQMVWPLSPRLESIDARTASINLPFSLDVKKMENACFADGATKLISSYVEPRNLKVLGILNSADLFFVFSNRDVPKVSDMKGSRVRVTGGKITLDIMRKLGVSPISMAASEMSTALAQGAIDGVYTSPAGWAEMIGMSGKYALHIPGLSLWTYVVVVDKEWFDALSPRNQAAITDTLKEISPRQWKEVEKENDEIIKKMVAQGAKFHVATPAEVNQVRALLKDVVPASNKQVQQAIVQLNELEKRCGITE